MVEANPKTRRRSQRVLLQLGVILTAAIPGRGSCQVQAFTLVVNAHGGLLEAPLKVTVNQNIKLTNPRSGQSADCRVVRVDAMQS